MGSRARSGAGKILSREKTWRKRRRCESKQVDSGLRTFGTAEIKISLLRSGSFSFGKNRRAYRQALYGDRSGGGSAQPPNFHRRAESLAQRSGSGSRYVSG